MQTHLRTYVLLALVGLAAACGGSGNEADRRGVGASCMKAEDCAEKEQQCLPFKGGYCGTLGCTKDADCPEFSACVTHTDQKNYCFRICVDKAECNRNRPLEFEANCSSSVTYVDSKKGSKACVPPSG